MDKSSVSGFESKIKAQCSTASQVQSRVVSLPNGPISKRPSISPLTSLATVLSSQSDHAASIGHRREGAVALSSRTGYAHFVEMIALGPVTL